MSKIYQPMLVGIFTAEKHESVYEDTDGCNIGIMIPAPFAFNKDIDYIDDNINAYFESIDGKVYLIIYSCDNDNGESEEILRYSYKDFLKLGGLMCEIPTDYFCEDEITKASELIELYSRLDEDEDEDLMECVKDNLDEYFDDMEDDLNSFFKDYNIKSSFRSFYPYLTESSEPIEITINHLATTVTET